MDRFDLRTAGAIRHAVGAARAGRLAEAITLGEQALLDGGDSAALHAMLGAYYRQTGEGDSSVKHLRAAHAALPTDPVITLNLAAALAEQQDYRGALGLLVDERVSTHAATRFERLRAFCFQAVEDFPAAIASYERVLQSAPDDWESWNNLGNAKRALGDLTGALAALRRAAELNPHSAPVRLNLGTTLVSAGEFEAAERHLRSMAEDFPEDAKPLRELHVLLKEQGRDGDALSAIEDAVSRAPDDVELVLALASHRLAMLQHNAAEEAYLHALKVEPHNELANMGLAVVYDLQNRRDALDPLDAEAELRGASAVACNFIRALQHRRAKRFAEGLKAIEQVPDRVEPVRRLHLLGQLRQGVGDHKAAFAAFRDMNELAAKHPSNPEDSARAYRTTIQSQCKAIGEEWFRPWRDVDDADAPFSPVFLVGFPRSGTTLLDTMLMGHPAVEVLEEEPTVRDAVAELPEIGQLPMAGEQQVRAAREAYLRTAKRFTPLDPGNLLIDKNPLNLNTLPFIRRIFPSARFILALRHPCDAVLSCFFSNFKLNSGMANFLRLDTAAELYDLSFSYFEKAQALFELPVHTVRYERLIEQPELELKQLLAFLGIDWSDSVLDHQRSAKARPYIKTASYAQVAEPLYTRSAGRWQNYRRQIEPVLPRLAPWATKFGYTV